MIKKIVKDKRILLILLVANLILFAGCSQTKVQSVEEETEANQIIDVLRENGITATKDESGEGTNKKFDIYINGGDIEYGAAIQLMEDHCLPQVKPPQIESEGIVPSGEVEKARDLRRMKMGIESQLRKLPGTTCVSVNLGQADDKQLTLNPDPASATVLVKYKTEKFDLNNKQIASMVAGGITGLEADKVFVTLTRQPLRPLPNLDSGRNLRRFLLVGGIGFATILGFILIVFFMRKNKDETDTDYFEENAIEGEITDGESQELLESGDEKRLDNEPEVQT